MKFLSKVLTVLVFGALLSGCSDFVQDESFVEDSSSDISSDIVPPEESKPRWKVSIRPIGMQLDGVSSLVVASNEGGPRTRSGETEQTNAPYALYSLDADGNIKLTLFYFEVVVHLIEDEIESPGEESPSEEDGEQMVTPDSESDSKPETKSDSDPDTVSGSNSNSGSESDSESDTQEEIIAQYVETIKKELADAIQVVPAIIADFGRYILFSGCQYYINDLVVSDEVRSICEEFIRNEKVQRNGDVFLIRKADGALFDVSSLGILRYKMSKNTMTSDCCEPYNQRSRYYDDDHNQLAEDSYAITPEGDLLVLGKSCIYKVEDNGDAIDFKPVTKSALDAFVMTPDEYLYLYNPHASIFSFVNSYFDISFEGLWRNLCRNQKFEYECYTPDGQFYLLDFSLFEEDEPFYYLGQYIDTATSIIYIRGLRLGGNPIFKTLTLSKGKIQGIRSQTCSGGSDYLDYCPFVIKDENSFYMRDSENNKVIYYIFRTRNCMWVRQDVIGADPSLLDPNNYDYSREEGNFFYGYKLIENQISIKKISVLGILENEELINVEIPHNSISVTANFYEQGGMICVALTGRTNDGGYWSLEYNLTTGEESQVQVENLNVVTIFKIN